MKMQTFKIVLIFMAFRNAQGTLLYPAATVFQMIGSVGAPITDLHSSRKIFFDWGFQMNYNMPFNLSSFYNVPIWAGINQRSESKRDIADIGYHSNDYSMAELYQGIENILESYSFDKSCLKLLICKLNEVAQPEDTFHLKSIIKFVLTPSLHNTNSNLEISAYHQAELNGSHNVNCSKIYSNCNYDGLPFDFIL